MGSIMNFLRRLFGEKEPRVGETPGGNGPEMPQPAKSVALSPAPPADTRPLSPLEETIILTNRMDVGHATGRGLVRPVNEDTLMVAVSGIEGTHSSMPLGFFLVADGMGGYEGGERASALAARAIAEHIMCGVVLPWLGNAPPDADQRTIQEVLFEAIEAADAAVNADVPEGGTTVTAAVIRDGIVYVAHVGDSRAYLITDDMREIEQLTRDQSLAARLVELGQISPDELRTHPQRHFLYSAIGKGEGLQVHKEVRRLQPGSRLLLCSDGLWEPVVEARMLEILRASPDPQEACRNLITEANVNGGPDNITAVLVAIP
jgi:serine/threonine protein phosphatase PrpC